MQCIDIMIEIITVAMTQNDALTGKVSGCRSASVRLAVESTQEAHCTYSSAKLEIINCGLSVMQSLQ